VVVNGVDRIIANASVTQLIAPSGAQAILGGNGDIVGFFGTSGTQKATVTGLKGSNAALGSLLTILANHGLITDGSGA
jgi:hypothetical protein